jgi:hypothetical protein
MPRGRNGASTADCCPPSSPHPRHARTRDCRVSMLSWRNHAVGLGSTAFRQSPRGVKKSNHPNSGIGESLTVDQPLGVVGLEVRANSSWNSWRDYPINLQASLTLAGSEASSSNESLRRASVLDGHGRLPFGFDWTCDNASSRLKAASLDARLSESSAILNSMG